MFLIYYQGFAQKETNIWYFGNKAGLDFNKGKPTVLSNGRINAAKGCATISTKNGRLLFYTDGGSVWDSTHTIMPNGTGLKGGYDVGWTFWSSTQSALIIPRPDSTNIYYIFTVDTNGGANGLKYSELNMKLNSGKGDIVSGKKNMSLVTPICEKLTGVKHINGKDFWLITQRYTTDTLYAYLITSSGVDKNPVKSKTGFILGPTAGRINSNTWGCMKISPNGRKIAYNNYGGTGYDTTCIGDFDAATGKVSNIWRFKTSKITNEATYGVEFSPKSNFLYLTSVYHQKVFQYNLNAANKSAFIASGIIVDSTSNNLNWSVYLQLGSDHKIYFNEMTDKYVNVIHAPDSAGVACRVRRKYLDLGTANCWGGLPNFISSYFWDKSFEVTRNCINDSTLFYFSDPTYPKDSVKWIFGDPSSGTNNISKKTTGIYHIYKKPGNYNVTLVNYYRDIIDTVKITVYIKDPKPYLGRDTSFCNSFAAILAPANKYLSYQWNTGSKKNNIITYDKGTFWLKVLDSAGCWSGDTITIKNPCVQSSFTISDTGQCLKNNAFSFKETTTYKDDNRKQSIWYFEDNTSITDSIAKKSFNNKGTYTIKLVSESTAGCMDSLSKTVHVYPQSLVGFEINDSSQCFNQHSFDFKIKKDTGKISYQWDLGDQSITMGKDVIAKRYLKTGNYKVSLTAITDKNCKDTAVKFVTVLPNPKADFIYDLACSRTITKFQFTGTKPPSPITTYFNWNFNNENTSTLENPSHKFAAAGTSNSTLILASDNGCTDTLIKTIEIKPQSKADFETTDVCESDSAVFVNKSQDATGYNWKFGDGQGSKAQDPRHKFQISSTTTFNVSLVALVTNGCSDSITKALTVNTNPDSDFSFTTTGTKVDLRASVQGNTKYQWKFGLAGGETDSATTTVGYYTHFIKSSDQYNVCLKVTNLAACTSQTCKNVTVGISDISRSSGFKIYPNPNSGSFIIEIENPGKEISIEVYDMMGRRVKRVKMVEKVIGLDLDVGEGIYLVRVNNGGVVWNQKVMVSFGGDTNR